MAQDAPTVIVATADMISASDSEKLKLAVAYLRSIAEPVGSLHTAWNYIITGEAMLQGDPEGFWPFDTAEDAIYTITGAAGLR